MGKFGALRTYQNKGFVAYKLSIYKPTPKPVLTPPFIPYK